MKKGIIIIISIVGLYLLLAIFGIDFIDGIFNKDIYIDNNVRWTYKNNQWTTKNYNRSAIIKLRNFKVYKPNTFEYFGKPNLKFQDNTWYIKEKGKFNQYGNYLIAFRGNGIKLYDYKSEYEIKDKQVINSILKEVNINGYNELNLENKIVIDLDNDGREEVIYAISNAYSESIESIRFSVIAVYRNGKYEIIKSLIDNENEVLDVFAIMDVDGDKKLEIIVVSEGFSDSGNTYALYALKNGKYNKLIET